LRSGLSQSEVLALIEGQASGDFENEAILVKYVSENIDQFCRRDDSGKFETLKEDEKALTTSEEPVLSLEERLVEYADPASRISFESLDLSRFKG